MLLGCFFLVLGAKWQRAHLEVPPELLMVQNYPFTSGTKKGFRTLVLLVVQRKYRERGCIAAEKDEATWGETEGKNHGRRGWLGKN